MRNFLNKINVETVGEPCKGQWPIWIFSLNFSWAVKLYHPMANPETLLFTTITRTFSQMKATNSLLLLILYKNLQLSLSVHA